MVQDYTLNVYFVGQGISYIPLLQGNRIRLLYQWEPWKTHDLIFTGSECDSDNCYSNFEHCLEPPNTCSCLESIQQCNQNATCKIGRKHIDWRLDCLLSGQQSNCSSVLCQELDVTKLILMQYTISSTGIVAIIK
jgi:hypothetical protein